MKRSRIAACCIAVMSTVALGGCAVVDKVTGAYDVVTGIGKEGSNFCSIPTSDVAVAGYGFDEQFCGATWPDKNETIRAVALGRTTVADGSHQRDSRFEVDYLMFTTGGGNDNIRIEASYLKPGVSPVEKYGYDNAASIGSGKTNLMEVVVYARYPGVNADKNSSANIREITYVGAGKARGGVKSTFIVELRQKVPFQVASVWDDSGINRENYVYFDTRQI